MSLQNRDFSDYGHGGLLVKVKVLGEEGRKLYLKYIRMEKKGSKEGRQHGRKEGEKYE